MGHPLLGGDNRITPQHTFIYTSRRWDISHSEPVTRFLRCWDFSHSEKCLYVLLIEFLPTQRRQCRYAYGLFLDHPTGVETLRYEIPPLGGSNKIISTIHISAAL